MCQIEYIFKYNADISICVAIIKYKSAILSIQKS